ncbi:MAG: YcgL domain-containing protein [Chromatiales bacterium]|nr:YcgL domain-containing protein [Chromatiales bacterium]
MSTTLCFIYRSLRKDGVYLFLDKEEGFDALPETLLKSLGKLEKAMELEIDADSKLAYSKPSDVLHNIKQQGFHIQLPPNEEKLPLAK